jgi:hypothetical protein
MTIVLQKSDLASNSFANTNSNGAGGVALRTDAGSAFRAELALNTGAGLVGFIQPGAGAVPRTLQSKGEDVLSVKDHGAVGDGVTDDTAAIQSALSAATGTLLFPAGVYMVTNITMPKNVAWIGHKAVIKKINNTPGNVFTGSVLNSAWYIEGLTFDGNYLNQTPLQNNCIIRAAGLQSKYWFTNCEFTNHEFCAVRIDGDANKDNLTYVNISDSRFFGGQEGDALAFAPRYVSIGGACNGSVSGNKFDFGSTPAASGVCGVATTLIGDSNSVSLVIADNHFVDVGRCATNRLGAIEAYGGAGGVIVQGNRISRAYGRGISVKANAKSSVISGNIVDGTVSDGVYAAHGITMSGTADDTTIGSGFICTNNVVQDAAGIGFNLIGDTLAPGFLNDATITGNISRNSASHNFNIEGYNNVICANNISKNSGDTAFKTNKLTGEFLFTGNMIDTVAANNGVSIFDDTFSTTTLVATGNTFKNIPLYGIVVCASASVGLAGFIITNNRFESITSSGIRFGGQTKVSLISDNTFTSSPFPFTSVTPSAFISAHANLTSLTNPPLLTLAADTITVWNDVHYVATEGGALTDDLSTINGGFMGRVVTLVASNNANDVVLKDAVGNLRLNGDFTLSHSDDTITLVFIGTTWREITRSDNTV